MKTPKFEVMCEYYDSLDYDGKVKFVDMLCEFDGELFALWGSYKVEKEIDEELDEELDDDYDVMKELEGK